MRLVNIYSLKQRRENITVNLISKNKNRYAYILYTYTYTLSFIHTELHTDIDAYTETFNKPCPCRCVKRSRNYENHIQFQPACVCMFL